MAKTATGSRTLSASAVCLHHGSHDPVHRTYIVDIGDECREYAIIAGVRQYGAQQVPEVAFCHQPVAKPNRLPWDHVLWCSGSAVACLHHL